VNPFEIKFERAFLKKVEAAYNKKADELVSGVAVEKYREEVGYLRGLRDVMKMIESVHGELIQK
jgi:hypothetical protein